MILKIWTDGACSGNPGPGGFGVIITQDGELIKKLHGNKYETTNNEMELMALNEALEYVVLNNIHEKKHRIEVYTDSAYVANSINQGWYINWKNNGWKTKEGSELKNKELWKNVIRLQKTINLRVIKVKGHADNLFNNMADKLAKAEVLKIKMQVRE
jgi:ribonuclease HI